MEIKHRSRRGLFAENGKSVALWLYVENVVSQWMLVFCYQRSRASVSSVTEANSGPDGRCCVMLVR